MQIKNHNEISPNLLDQLLPKISVGEDVNGVAN